MYSAFCTKYGTGRNCIFQSEGVLVVQCKRVWQHWTQASHEKEVISHYLMHILLKKGKPWISDLVDFDSWIFNNHVTVMALLKNHCLFYTFPWWQPEWQSRCILWCIQASTRQQHTHTQDKWKIYIQICPGTILQFQSTAHITSKTAKWLCWLLREMRN